MRNINFIIIIGTFFISNLGFGQDTLTISKKYFVQKANDKNLQLQIANQAFKSAQADYRQSNALFCLASLHRTPRFQPQMPWWLLGLNWIRRFYQLRILIPLCWMIWQWPKTTPLKYWCCSRLSTWTDCMEGRPPSPKIEVFQLQTDSHLETSNINILLRYLHF